MACIDEKIYDAKHKILVNDYTEIKGNVKDLWDTLFDNGFQTRIANMEANCKTNTKLMYLILSTILIFALGACGGVYMIMNDIHEHISISTVAK